MKFSVQLYGPLNQMQGGVEEKLSALKNAGITWIEPCIAVGDPSLPPDVFWPAEWVIEHAELFRGLGMKITSAHVFSDRLLTHTAELKALAKATGLSAFVLKTPSELSPESLQQAALAYIKLADELQEDGVELWLHNEAADIQARLPIPGGEGTQTAYEALLDLCMGKVYAQVDVGWVWYGGEDPMEFLHRNAARVRAVHYKDFPQGTAEPVDCPIGSGALDCAACFRFAQARNLPQLIDQEHFVKDVPKELSDLYKSFNQLANRRENTVSYLNTYDTQTGEVRVLCRFPQVIEAPNWLKGSDEILYNADGRMYRYDLTAGTSSLLDTGICTQCNNDHVVSPDEESLAVSHMTYDAGFTSRVYIVPMDGGEARLVTPNSPSFLHGWSPDGKELAYCAFRQIDGRQEVDVYVISAEGGQERRLTAGGFNDGPEYSPDGNYIWYNSTRSGLMQVWRMARDGSEQTQLTKNRRNNWFPHISPDGKKAVYLSYAEDQLEPAEHLPNMPVELWLMNADGSGQHKILSLFGGQGSINVNSWAGDSRRFAFVSYELL